MSSDTARHIIGKLPSGPGSEGITSLWRHAISTKQEHFRIAVLVDYQHVALSLADWSVLDARSRASAVGSTARRRVEASCRWPRKENIRIK
jgi:hypothetical protein